SPAPLGADGVAVDLDRRPAGEVLDVAERAAGLCATSTASRLPAFCSWTLVIWTSVLGDIRTYEPSGNWMAAWPVCVLTLSLALSASPAVPGLPFTLTVWL